MAQVKGQAKEREAPTSLASVYLHVVDDVIQSVRDDFQSEGVDESVLVELRQLWELKMMATGVIEGAAAHETVGTANAPRQVHDLNVPYNEALNEYQTPTVDLLFPPTPQAMTPLPATPQLDLRTPQMDAPSPALTSTGEPIMYQYMPPGPTESRGGRSGSLDIDNKLGRPALYMAQPTWMLQQSREIDVNLNPYDEGPEEDDPGSSQAPVTKDFFTGKRKREDLTTGSYLSGNYIPQQDGAGDFHPKFHSTADDEGCVSERLAGQIPDPRLWRPGRSIADSRIIVSVDAVSQSGSSPIPQWDGMGDDYDDGVAEEDYNEPGEEEPQPAADLGSRVLKVEPAAEESDGAEPPLNEEDDDDLDENDQGDEEPQTDNLVLAQFDKVTRSKNKWKCTLKHGVMHLNNKDTVFAKATGEFEF